MGLGAVPAGMWALVLCFALTAIVLSFAPWYRGVVKVDANTAGLFTGFVPVSAVAVGVLFLSEDLLRAHAGGLACVLAAVVLGTRSTKPPFWMSP